MAQNRELNASLARVTKLSIIYGSVLLLLLDWLAELNLIPSSVSFFLRAAILSICIFYIAITGISFGKYRFNFGSCLGFFIIINIIYSIFSPSVINEFYYTSRILLWTSITVATYRLLIFGFLREKELRNFIYAIILLGALFTLYHVTRPGVEAGQNASAYLLVWSIPLALLCSGRSKLKWILIGLASLAVILTVKRGAMVALGLSGLAYYLYGISVKSNAMNFFTRTFGLVVIMALCSLAVLSNYDAFESRFSETGGSGRDIMYALIVGHWLEADTMTKIFGYGINSVQRFTGQMFYDAFSNKSGPYAHSDWLQLIHDFGVVGFLILSWIHVSVLRLIISGYKMNLEYTPALIMGYVILFLVNIYSGHLFAPGAFIFGVLVAYCAAELRSAEQRNVNV